MGRPNYCPNAAATDTNIVIRNGHPRTEPTLTHYGHQQHNRHTSPGRAPQYRGSRGHADGTSSE